MRGEPVLPSKFVSLFDSSFSVDCNSEQVRKNFIVYHELDHHFEKFDESLVDFNRRLTQTVNDVRDLLNSTYARFPRMDKLKQLVDLDANEQNDDLCRTTNDSSEGQVLLDQSSHEHGPLPEPLAPEILPLQTTNDH
jgi:hypothetical protein